MKQLISRVFSGTTDRSSEIFMDLEKQEYGIQYFDELGKFVRTDYFPGKTEQQVKNYAEDWVLERSCNWHCDMLHSEMSDLMVSVRSLISTLGQRNITLTLNLIQN